MQTGIVFDMGTVGGCDHTAAMCCTADGFVAGVNGASGGRVVARGLQLEEHLGVDPGETTPDGRITLGHEECLGACAYAPMMRVDDTYHEDLDLERAKKILDELE